MNTAMDSWIGSDIREATATLGAPSRTWQEGGERWLIWDRSAILQMPQHSYSTANKIGTQTYINTRTVGGQVIQAHCEITLKADSTGRIVAWSYYGNDCSGRRYRKPKGTSISPSLERLSAADQEKTDKMLNWILDPDWSEYELNERR